MHATAKMLSYSTQCSDDDERDLVINKSGTQRDETKIRHPSYERRFCEPVNITV